MKKFSLNSVSWFSLLGLAALLPPANGWTAQRQDDPAEEDTEEEVEKESGVPICVPLPRVGINDDAPIITSFSEALREQMGALMAGPLVDPRPVAARLAVQVRAEAAKAGCKYLLIVTFAHKPASKIGRRTADAAMTVGSAAQSFVDLGGTASGALGAASIFSGLLGSSGGNDGGGGGFYPVGKSDQVTISYSLDRVDGKETQKTGKFSGTASKNNEPLVDTLIEKLAEQVITGLEGK